MLRPPAAYTLARACDIVEPFLAKLGTEIPQLQKLVAAGSIRRFEPLVEELIVVGCADDPEGTIDLIAALPVIEGVLRRAPGQLIVRQQRAPVDVRVARPNEYATVLVEATGTSEHVALLAAAGATGKYGEETDLYSAAGLPWIPPELRLGLDEVEIAGATGIPSLIEVPQIRGDLHMHSTYSDGQDSLQTMVAAASVLGYEYIAITDHSARAGAARTVSLESLERQRDEIHVLRERYPSMGILHGIEADIMPDGRLDFDDDVLASLDIVLASLHDDAGHSGRSLTRRCLAAIRHPLVTIISHPANRIVGRRPDYPLDYEALYEAAADTGTALEIDGAPAHLDMDGAHARAAIASGVTVSIDSDCHRAAALARNMRFGVGTARRGWVEARQVLNARTLPEVRRFIAAKRRGEKNGGHGT